MIRDHSPDIERYVSHFQVELEKIPKIMFCDDSKTSTEVHKKLIYSAIIDTFAKCVYPNVSSNRERIIQTLAKFSGWEHHDRVSLPHLYKLLQMMPEPDFSNVRDFCIEEMSKWKDGEIIGIERDPKIFEIKKLWPSEKDFKRNNITIHLEFIQHSSLWYKNRNSLVHEFRDLGYGFGSVREYKPYYVGFEHFDEDETKTWELTYPANFFKTLAITILNQLDKYLKKHNINPYNSYKFGSFWLEELNN